VVDQEYTVEGQRFRVTRVPGALDVTLVTGPSAGLGFTMGGRHASPARILDACRRFLKALDQSNGRVDYQ
jgi:hypothetical protein